MKTSTCIEKLACKDCGSPDALQTYLNVDSDLEMEWYSSFCHSTCGEQKGDPYGDCKAPEVHIKTKYEIQEELDTIASCPDFCDSRKVYRGIPSKFYKSWGVKLLYSEFDGKTPYAIGFPVYDESVVSGYKCRPLRKKDFYGVGKTTGVDLFGWERAILIPGDILWITEGEFDSIALDYCLTLVGTDDMYPVTSVTHGGDSIEKNFIKMGDRLNRYRVIVLVLDDDIVGHKAEVTAKGLWGKKLVIIGKPKNCKDANDAVKQGYAELMGKMALGLK